MSYHSQFDQDQYLDRYVFKGKTDGFFVEIGALDGVAISNTLFFEEDRNWKGVCIEPKPDSFELLKKNRKCICIHGCISANPLPTVTFLNITGYPEALSCIAELSTPEHLNRVNSELAREGGEKTLITVPNYNFNSVITETNIDYVSIDTEGCELEILQSIDFNKYQINCFTVENNGTATTVRDFLKTKAYKKVGNLGCDEVYAKEGFLR